MTTSEKIDAIIKEKGLSRRQVAIKAQVPPSSFQSAMERNKNISIDMLRKIAAALEVDWKNLVADDELGSYIAADIIERAGLTIRDSKENVSQQKKVKFTKLTEPEIYRYGFLQFKSEEDRIAFFYSRLNTDGKLAASACFFRHLREDSLTDVADYVLSLAENPLYQREKTSEQDDQAQDTTDTQD